MEYPDVIDPATLARAVTLTRTLRRTSAGSVEELAATAVMRTYCTCVTGAEDAAEHRFSAIHGALVDDVAAAVSATEAARDQRGSSTETAPDPGQRLRPESSRQAVSRWDNEGGAVARRVDIARRR